jgi:hypothetical protein
MKNGSLELSSSEPPFFFFEIQANIAGIEFLVEKS